MRDDEIMIRRLKFTELNIPTTSELEKELNREKNKIRCRRVFKNIICVLVVVVAFSVLITSLFFPALKIYGNSMEPTLNEGDILVSIKDFELECGDVVAFYYNNRILVKRVIAVSSEWVEIDLEGNVFVNDKFLSEAYIKEKSYGNVDIEFPYQVPDGFYFVLRDYREVSIDSRNSMVGSVLKRDIIGKVIFRVFPINRFGMVN